MAWMFWSNTQEYDDVSVCISMCVYIYICMYVYMYVCMNMMISLETSFYVCTYTRMYVCTYVRTMHVCMYVRTHVCMCVWLVFPSQLMQYSESKLHLCHWPMIITALMPPGIHSLTNSMPRNHIEELALLLNKQHMHVWNERKPLYYLASMQQAQCSGLYSKCRFGTFTAGLNPKS